MIEDHRQDIEKALKEERRRALKEERQRGIDWQIMAGNRRDLANVYARSMLLQSCYSESEKQPHVGHVYSNQHLCIVPSMYSQRSG